MMSESLSNEEEEDKEARRARQKEIIKRQQANDNSEGTFSRQEGDNINLRGMNSMLPRLMEGDFEGLVDELNLIKSALVD